jgi:hypothetical protein
LQEITNHPEYEKITQRAIPVPVKSTISKKFLYKIVISQGKT